MTREIAIPKEQHTKQGLVDTVVELLERNQDKEVESFRVVSDEPLIRAGGSKEVVVSDLPDKWDVTVSIANDDLEKIVVDGIKESANVEASRDQRNTTAEDVELSRERHETATEDDIGGIIGRVSKPFSHEDANYLEKGDSGFDPNHPRCKDCAHFDGEGSCHIVPDIKPEGYCTEFYSDLGLFLVQTPGGFDTNLTLAGEELDVDEGDIDEICDSIHDALSGVVGDEL